MKSGQATLHRRIVDSGQQYAVNPNFDAADAS